MLSERTLMIKWASEGEFQSHNYSKQEGKFRERDFFESSLFCVGIKHVRKKLENVQNIDFYFLVPPPSEKSEGMKFAYRFASQLSLKFICCMFFRIFFVWNAWRGGMRLHEKWRRFERKDFFSLFLRHTFQQTRATKSWIIHFK